MISQVCGWLGAASLLLAYVMVSTGRLRGESSAFNWINITGGALLAYGSWVKAAWPSVTLNVVWIFIGLRAVFVKTRKNPSS